MEQRRIRERIRDEQIVSSARSRRLARRPRKTSSSWGQPEEARLESELAHGQKQAKLAAKVAELERRLAEAHANKERAVARAQLTRSGHVYVISNIGSFGEHVYKIGMTRRLDPIERIYELGDASVPFDFDVHAVIFAEMPPALEAALHRTFANRRVNRVNERKEFFKVGIEEIVAEVRKHHAEIAFYDGCRGRGLPQDACCFKATRGCGHSRGGPFGEQWNQPQCLNRSSWIATMKVVHLCPGCRKS